MESPSLDKAGLSALLWINSRDTFRGQSWVMQVSKTELGGQSKAPSFSCSPDLINPWKGDGIQSAELSTTRSFSCRYLQSSHQCLLWLGFEQWGHRNRNKPLWKKNKIFFLGVFPHQRLNLMTVLQLGLTASTDPAALKGRHIGKSTGFWDALFTHHLRLSLESRGAGDTEGLARCLERLAEGRVGTGHA